MTLRLWVCQFETNHHNDAKRDIFGMDAIPNKKKVYCIFSICQLNFIWDYCRFQNFLTRSWIQKNVALQLAIRLNDFFFFVWSDVHCLFNEHYNAFCLFLSLKLQPEPRLEQKLHLLEIGKGIRIFIHNLADIKFVYWWLKKGNKKQTRKKTLHLNKSHPWWNATPKYQF